VKKDEGEIRREFGAVLSELPEAPRHFNLYFRVDTSELTEESRAILPDVMSAVAARKVPEVTVIGHTDTTGSTASNYQLGLQRAQTVRDLLLKAGLDASMIEVSSHGEADLLQSTPDNTAEPRNRRVEITIR
jgi:outer membrane protein OmpA-like peptidoglycan-associated protein